MHAGLLDYLGRAAPKVILYDVNFADPDTALGFSFAGSTWTGAESDRAFAEAVRKAGNVLTLADATYEGDADVPPVRDPGFVLEGGGLTERRVMFPPFPDLAAAVAGFGHNLFVLDADGRSGTPCLSSDRAASACRRWGWPARCTRPASGPRTCASMPRG